jgi:hypothetical protein
MARRGWSDESGGNTNAVSGWFARVSIEYDELDEVAEAFAGEIHDFQLERHEELLGHYLVTAGVDEQVYVTEYEDPADLVRDFGFLQEGYRIWLGQERPQ